VQVVAVEANQPGADRDGALLPGLRPGAVVVDPRQDADLAFGRGDVFVTEPERFADPNAFPGVRPTVA